MTDQDKKHFADSFVDAVKAGRVPGISIDPDNPAMAYEPMPLSSKDGQRMRFTGHGGYDSQQEHARKLLQVDGVYTVAHVEVGSWMSYVEFKEFPGVRFNTVMFAAADGELTREDRNG